MRVYLTGGTGLIGSHVAERLRERGDDVVALVRGSSDTAHLEGLGCDLVEGDLEDPAASLAEGMRGCDAVVHAAAMVFTSAPRAEYIRSNVEGTRTVLAAAALAAPRVVHTSSVAVYSSLPWDRPLTEDRWTEADPDRQPAYPASKTLSERAAWERHEAGDIRLTTVRPSVVYGERDRHATPIIMRFAGRRIVPLIGGGRTELPLVYAGNVARGVVAALDRSGAVGRAYNLARDVPITGRELMRRVGREMGRTPTVFPVPTAAARGVAEVVRFGTGALPGVRRVDPRRAVRSLSMDNPYDSSRARLELGWTGLTPHAEGVRRTAAWWRQAG